MSSLHSQYNGDDEPEPTSPELNSEAHSVGGNVGGGSEGGAGGASGEGGHASVGANVMTWPPLYVEVPHQLQRRHVPTSEPPRLIELQQLPPTPP
eukprot:3460022-Prymnesium_polylepis.1